MSKAPAVDYALEIIELFASKHKEIGIADISNALNINKNAVSRVIEALLEKRWIYMSDHSHKKYSLTLRPLSLIGEHNSNIDIIKIATPYLKKINEELGDSVYLGVKYENNVLYLLHFDSTREVRINGYAGGKYPLNCSASGKILLSCLPPEEIHGYFDSSINKRTEHTITNFDDFVLEANKIRNLGYAIDNEEFANGIICIAVPVFDYAKNVVASIGISTLTIYDDVNSLINIKLGLLKKASDEISLCLGKKLILE